MSGGLISHCVGSHSLYRLLSEVARGNPQATALLAPGRTAITYGQMLDHMDCIHESLLSMGLGRGDRIATVLVDSSETALAMICIMAFATATPINPGHAPQEIARQLKNLQSRAVIISRQAPAELRAVVEESNLAVIELERSRSNLAGGFELSGIRVAGSTLPDRASCGGEDSIIVVQTSGTTGTPKVVALKQNQLLSMMLANCQVLGLTPEDRCLNVMPLFHVHGLGAVLVSLLSGGSVVVTEGFSADGFLEQVREFKPTWYTSVPTIHQAVLARAEASVGLTGTPAGGGSIRMVRSGSAPMPRGVPERLEAVFGAVYIEACGATECSAYISSNRPHNRKTGSQGLPMPGTDVRVIDEEGNNLPAGHIGEMIVRGPGVFDGYEGDAELNASAFYEGYFRTGDLVYRDEDGFIFIAGRIKEQINRGGMKVSPMKVDDVILRHPAVRQCVTFGVPDERLGEEIACAVIAHPGKPVNEIELQRHAAAHLGDFEVPRRIILLDEIPKGPTGKIVRIGLAQKLGLGAGSPSAAPVAHAIDPDTPIQQMVASLWSVVLKTHVVDIDTTFMQLGGDSLQATQMVLEVEREFGIRIPIAALFTHGTIRKLSELIVSEGWRAQAGAPVILREGNESGPTLFCLPGIGGNVYCFQSIASGLDAHQRVVGLPLPGADGLEAPMTSFEDITARFLGLMRMHQPTGPYLLAGYSFGGRLAVAIAHRLSEDGEVVRFLGLLDTPGPNWPGPGRMMRRIGSKMIRITDGLRRAMGGQVGQNRSSVANGQDEAMPGLLLPDGADDERRRRQEELVAACRRASRRWKPSRVSVKITLLRARISAWTNCDVSDESMGWGKYAKGGMEIVTVPGSHGTIFHNPFSLAVTREIAARI